MCAQRSPAVISWPARWGMFWDLHDGTDFELWAPNGVADQFDQVDGGSNLHDPASHKLLDVLFGYLGGKKPPREPRPRHPRHRQRGKKSQCERQAARWSSKSRMGGGAMLLGAVLVACGPRVGSGDSSTGGSTDVAETDEIVEPTWMLGVFNEGAPFDGAGGSSVTNVEFLPHGEMVRRTVTECRDASRKERTETFRWTLLESGEIEVEYFDGEETSYSTVRRVGCDREVDALEWETHRETPPATFTTTLWRGEMCLEPAKDVQHGDPQCQTVWCDDPPPPCEE